MTGYTVHTGASKKFVNGWDRIFTGQAEDSTKAQKQKKASGARKKSAGKKQKKKS